MLKGRHRMVRRGKEKGKRGTVKSVIPRRDRRPSKASTSSSATRSKVTGAPRRPASSRRKRRCPSRPAVRLHKCNAPTRINDANGRRGPSSASAYVAASRRPNRRRALAMAHRATAENGTKATCARSCRIDSATGTCTRVPKLEKVVINMTWAKRSPTEERSTPPSRNSRRSAARSRSSPKPRSRSRHSSCAKA